MGVIAPPPAATARGIAQPCHRVGGCIAENAHVGGRAGRLSSFSGIEHGPDMTGKAISDASSYAVWYPSVLRMYYSAYAQPYPLPRSALSVPLIACVRTNV